MESPLAFICQKLDEYAMRVVSLRVALGLESAPDGLDRDDVGDGACRGSRGYLHG